MSCHTWSYVKVKALPEKEKINAVNESIHTLENWWGFKDTFEEVVQKVKSWKKNEKIFRIKNPEEYAKNMINEFKNKIAALKEKGFDAFFEQNKYSADFCNYQGEWYYNVGFDTPFRGYGYDDIKLTDKKSVLKWCRENSDDVICYDFENKKDIKGYSAHLLNEVDDFFNKYGEDNILIEFG